MSLGAQYAIGGQWRNNSRKNEGVEPKHVMYGCESWTIKKAKRQRIDAFELWY